MQLEVIQVVLQAGQLIAFVVGAFKVGRWVGAIEARMTAVEDRR